MLHDSISGYRAFQAEGDSYLNVGRSALRRPEVFNAEIRFNVLSMAIEKHVMAILMEAGALPDNHTFRDLTYAMDQVAPLEPSTVEFLHRMDSFNDICSLSEYSRSAPDEDCLANLLTIAESIRDMADGLLGPLGPEERALARPTPA